MSSTHSVATGRPPMVRWPLDMSSMTIQVSPRTSVVSAERPLSLIRRGCNLERLVDGRRPAVRQPGGREATWSVGRDRPPSAAYRAKQHSRRCHSRRLPAWNAQAYAPRRRRPKTLPPVRNDVPRSTATNRTGLVVSRYTRLVRRGEKTCRYEAISDHGPALPQPRCSSSC
jgi:hypothetical protein